MYCKYCGKQIADNSTYCKFCGRLVAEEETSAQSSEDNIAEAKADENSEKVEQRVVKTPLGTLVTDYSVEADENDAEDDVEYVEDYLFEHISAGKRAALFAGGVVLAAVVAVAVYSFFI